MKKRLIATIILMVYTTILISVIVFKVVPLFTIGRVKINLGGIQAGPGNFVPFKSILPYLLLQHGFMISFVNLVGNIVILVPMGFLVPFVFRNMTWKKSLALAVAAGIVIEGTQVVLGTGIFDIDDVILNGLGVIIGYWMFKMLTKSRKNVSTISLRKVA